MTVAAGESPPVVLATPLVRTSQKPSTTAMDSLSSLGLINWSWRATTGVTIAMLWPSSVPLTTATAVATKLLSWNWMMLWSIHSFSLTQPLDEESRTWQGERQTTSSRHDNCTFNIRLITNNLPSPPCANKLDAAVLSSDFCACSSLVPVVSWTGYFLVCD